MYLVLVLSFQSLLHLNPVKATLKCISVGKLLSLSLYLYLKTASAVTKKIQVGNDQEKAQSERNFYFKNQGGEKLY